MSATSGLHIDSRGAGPDLVLLHGWGMNSAVWQGVLPAFETAWRVHMVDLPGHGCSRGRAGSTLSELAETVHRAIAPRLAGPARWLGWSLGGMLGLWLAAHRAPVVGRLVMAAASPRFTAGEDWPWGVPAEVLEGFAESLEDDYRGTLLRFLALQTRGAEGAGATRSRLREALFAAGEPDPAALRAGLGILRSADLRPKLARCEVPVLLLGGSRDTLVPPAALEAAARTAPKGAARIVEGAGHAPFLSHPEAFLTACREFLDT